MTLHRAISQRFSKNPSTSNGKANGFTATKSFDKPTDKEMELVSDFRENVKKGLSFSMETSTLAAVLDVLRHKDAIDDRKMLLEKGLLFLSKMHQGSLATTLSNGAIKLLYDDLPHPPATYLGKDYQWRKADGSYNNVDVPDLGKAGTPYARSVQQGHPLPPAAMPDAGLIFDTLLRRGHFKQHPAGLSSMMFAFAALVIHTVFQTSHSNVSINETSSYVDLAPLYGNNDVEQNKIRVRNGRGLLYPDVFAEDRLMLLPPACCVLLVLFNRNHNYIAKKIFEINERGTYDPAILPSQDPKKMKRLVDQEDEIFEIARLCNIAWFGSIVFSDYFSNILGLVREGNTWVLNPFGEIRNEDHTLFERGRGNVCSVEFNCLYRWHATTSAHDEKWVEAVFTNLFHGKDPDSLTVEDFMVVAKEIKEKEPDIKDWTFGNMQRGEDHFFKDEDLARYIHEATEHPAGAFGARNTPHIMRLHEIMGIEANRRWGVCNLNEFRKFLGLKPYASFSEWNHDPEVANTAEKLYGDIENLELYVGLQAEDAKPVIEGAGLCPGYTVSRAILSDAIALTRGDRFFTHDYTPYNMTAWGFNDCQRDSNSPGFGSMLGRLFLRTLPEHFTENSIYTWFPFMTPDAMKPHLTKLNVINKYDTSKPKVGSAYTVVKGHAEIAQILSDTEGFKTPYFARASTVIEGKGFFLATEDSLQGAKDHEQVIKALADSPESVEKITQFFFDNTREHIKQSSYSPVVGKTHIVDIVREVLKYVPLRWAATEIAGISLKTKSNSSGTYTESELFDILGDIYSYIFLEGDAGRQMVLEEKVKGEVQKLLSHIKSHLKGLARLSGFVGTVTSAFINKQKKSEHGEIFRRLTALGYSHDHLANSILAILVGSTVELSVVCTNTVNLLLSSNQDSRIRSLFGDADNAAELQGFVYEALRLEPPFNGVFRIAQKDVTVSSLSVKKNERVFLDIASASVQESVFANASTIDPKRTPKDRYLIGEGTFKTLGGDLASKIVASVLHAVMGLPNLRRGPGQSGQLHGCTDVPNPSLRYHVDPTIRHAYLDKSQLLAPWPNSLTVEYDDTVLPAPAAEK